MKSSEITYVRNADLAFIRTRCLAPDLRKDKLRLNRSTSLSCKQIINMIVGRHHNTLVICFSLRLVAIYN